MRPTAILLSAVGVALAQGVTEQISPDGTAPEGCQKSLDGQYWVSTGAASTASKRGLEKRAENCGDGNLVVTLADGVMTDALGRTGYIASNYQFQFDGPPQAGAIYTAGFSVCAGGVLALGSSTAFYKCLSGDFSNLYDRSWAEQCSATQITLHSCDGSGSGPPGGAAHQAEDGQVPVSTDYVSTTMVRPIADGQPQVIVTSVPVPICQINDGQVQAHETPCASITSTPPAPPPEETEVPVSQYPDGQIQVTPPASSEAPPPETVAPSEPSQAPSKPPTSEPSPPPVSMPTPVPVPSSTPAVVPTSNAGRVDVSSIAALVIGIFGAVAFL